MKTRTIISAALAMLLAVPALTPLPAVAEPQVFMGVAGENGYVVMDPQGQVHYTITNDGAPYYYGYCRHHHRKHRCRYVPRPRHHHPKPPKHKHKKHHKDDRSKHRKHHDRHRH